MAPSSNNSTSTDPNVTKENLALLEAYYGKSQNPDREAENESTKVGKSSYALTDDDADGEKESFDKASHTEGNTNAIKHRETSREEYSGALHRYIDAAESTDHWTPWNTRVRQSHHNRR
ncbi:hypothetical protein ABW20_dc0100497 [Dactylellina cionopaga]|nr:hypothetical protein ABW20_dc0100497 [Dactylellina cionopaga]